jgi:hypothetical protein
MQSSIAKSVVELLEQRHSQGRHVQADIETVGEFRLVLVACGQSLFDLCSILWLESRQHILIRLFILVFAQLFLQGSNLLSQLCCFEFFGVAGDTSSSTSLDILFEPADGFFLVVLWWAAAGRCS